MPAEIVICAYCRQPLRGPLPSSSSDNIGRGVEEETHEGNVGFVGEVPQIPRESAGSGPADPRPPWSAPPDMEDIEAYSPYDRSFGVQELQQSLLPSGQLVRELM